MSCDDKDIVDALIEWTKETYEDLAKHKQTRFNIRDCISMTLDYTTSGEVKFIHKNKLIK